MLVIQAVQWIHTLHTGHKNTRKETKMRLRLLITLIVLSLTFLIGQAMATDNSDLSLIEKTLRSSTERGLTDDSLGWRTAGTQDARSYFGPITTMFRKPSKVLKKTATAWPLLPGAIRAAMGAATSVRIIEIQEPNSTFKKPLKARKKNDEELRNWNISIVDFA
jgi:hypothetical protein